MKRTLPIGVVGAFVLAMGTAAAGDLPLKAPPLAKPYNWYGFYVGGTAGYAWGSDPINVTYGPAIPVGLPASVAGNPRGFIGGLEYGTNYQFGRWVLGTESDFSLSDISSSGTASAAGLTATGTQKLTSFSTSRGRVGYTVQDNILLFGTAGLADGTAKTSFASTDASCLLCFSDAKTLWGWTAGAGVEYGTGPWSMKVEYLHYDLGHLNQTVTNPTGALVAATSTRFSGEIVRAGVNYHFPWTPWDVLLGRR